ncbi:hypothetical protein, partial [Rodentibacter trehalosifermentans]|uniref:hypothetical protein n=1 Tax=Rodentibacter trehalosifermentans TaxID=1908263 RepID=UPI001C4E2E6F
ISASESPATCAIGKRRALADNRKCCAIKTIIPLLQRLNFQAFLGFKKLKVVIKGLLFFCAEKCIVI